MTGSLTRLAHLAPVLDRLIEAATPESKEQATRPLERRVRRGLAAMWADQRRLLLDRLPEHRHRFAEAIGDDDLDALWAAVTASTVGPMAELLDLVAPQAMRRGHRAATGDVGRGLTVSIGVSFDLEHPAAVDYLTGYGANRVAGIDATTRDGLRSLLTQAADQGWSYQRTAQQIRARFAGFGGRSPLGHIRDRAELVAVTEVGAAYEHGQQMLIGQLADEGVSTEKAWLSAEDERVCPVCEPAADAGWIPSGEQFPNGMGGPLGHPGCRCALSVQVAAESRV